MDKPALKTRIRICHDFKVYVDASSRELLKSELSWVLGDNCVLERWSQLESMLSHYRNYSSKQFDSGPNAIIDKACDMLTALCESECEDNINLSCVSFCVEQLQLSAAAACRRRYSSDMMRLAFLLHNRSSACYRILYDLRKLILPHPSSLHKLSAVFNVNPGVEGEDHAKYLKFRASQLTEKQRYVVLQLDEIHMNASLEFKSGCITGAAINAEQTLAHSVQGFMISSMFGSTKEVVALCPVKDLNSTDLLVMLNKVLHLVQANGFVVVCIIADKSIVYNFVFFVSESPFYERF